MPYTATRSIHLISRTDHHGQRSQALPLGVRSQVAHKVYDILEGVGGDPERPAATGGPASLVDQLSVAPFLFSVLLLSWQIPKLYLRLHFGVYSQLPTLLACAMSGGTTVLGRRWARRNCCWFVDEFHPAEKRRIESCTKEIFKTPQNYSTNGWFRCFTEDHLLYPTHTSRCREAS